MFDIEKGVVEWRRQMASGGLGSPDTLDELESHLREDVERQMRLGVNASEAFEIAVARIGQPKALKIEFAKAGGLLRIFGADKSTRIDRILAALWFAGCSWSFITLLSLPYLYNPETTLLC